MNPNPEQDVPVEEKQYGGKITGLNHEATRYDTALLIALQRKPMYVGTVSWVEKQSRRAVGRRAKQARKLNR